MEQIKDKWPDAQFEDIEISAEHLHTDGLYYDQYESGDYTEYIVITYTKPKRVY